MVAASGPLPTMVIGTARVVAPAVGAAGRGSGLAAAGAAGWSSRRARVSTRARPSSDW